MVGASDITLMLRDVEAGREGALDRLMTLVYEDLARMARGYLRKQFGDRAEAITLEPAALVNESFMQLIRQRKAYDNRGHFFAIATRSMLRVLVDYRRRRNAAKRGGADTHITLVLDERQVAERRPRCVDLIEVEELAKALEKLETLDPRKAEVVKMRVVWGLDIAAITDALAVSRSTVERDWRFAKAWLADEVGPAAPSGGQPRP
ncbi:MAG: ECF-type sigma factor [Planctomycetota bacterium]|jgi:RNA polymerase sigma factor (TIGR02999 family)